MNDALKTFGWWATIGALSTIALALILTLGGCATHVGTVAYCITHPQNCN